MVRKNRVWLPGAKYHITRRGIRQYPLFHDDYDRMQYMKLLTETKELYPFHLPAYCLMTSHIHFQMELVETTTSYFMKTCIQSMLNTSINVTAFEK
ncbi:hypothetical protein R4Z09_01625 [Niallia oryzisoli]|uniref:Transposase n=1 Tax=Niallia oryzisoli TaxID=1737571 RepID=A0ABZ2CIL2_9BACI